MEGAIAYRDLIGDVEFHLQRESAFSYACHACKRCCHYKAIRVGAYEILRLSRNLGISTTEFIGRYTEAGGTVLRTREENGACVFLNERGCGVHPDRPLACRLYPLARWVNPDGHESFGLLTPHPQTEGVYGVGGAVEDYLRGQGVAPFFTMGDAYGEVYERMLAVLACLDPSELDFRPERRAAISEMAAGSLGSAFLDVDATVDAYCAQHNFEKPTDVDKLVELHIKAVLEWLQTLTMLNHDENAMSNRPEAGERNG